MLPAPRDAAYAAKFGQRVSLSMSLMMTVCLLFPQGVQARTFPQLVLLLVTPVHQLIAGGRRGDPAAVLDLRQPTVRNAGYRGDRGGDNAGQGPFLVRFCLQLARHGAQRFRHIVRSSVRANHFAHLSDSSGTARRPAPNRLILTGYAVRASGPCPRTGFP